MIKIESERESQGNLCCQHIISCAAEGKVEEPLVQRFATELQP